jgi:hypothetical protein
MGLVGVVHVSASVIAVLSSYWLLVPLLVEFSQSQLTGGNESSALHQQHQQLNESLVLSSLINGISTAVSTISSVGLMWMIPAPSKKYARLFACSSITCLSIAFTQLDFFLMVHDGKHEESVHFIRTVVVFGGVPFCLVSYIDTWCSFTLLTYDRSFPTQYTKDTAAMMDESHKQLQRGT